MLTRVFLLSCFVNNFLLMLCTLIGAIMQSINIQIGLNICVNYMYNYMIRQVLHRRPIEGRHLVNFLVQSRFLEYNQRSSSNSSLLELKHFYCYLELFLNRITRSKLNPLYIRQYFFNISAKIYLYLNVNFCIIANFF